MGAKDKGYSSDHGAIFLQPEGPNHDEHFMGCFDLGDIDEAMGDVDLIRCLSDTGCGWDVQGETPKAPDAVKTSLATIMKKTATWLEKATGANQGVMSLYVLTRQGGDPKLFTNYVRMSVLHHMRMTSHKRAGLANRDEAKPGELSWEISAWPPVYDIFQLKANRVTQTSALALNSINYLMDCLSPCKVGWEAGDAAGGAPANVYYYDSTVTVWTATATQPFGNAENIAFIRTVPSGVDSYRVIVGRGTTDGANPAEIAYMDVVKNAKSAWHAVNVGSVNGEFFVGHNSITVVDYSNMWVCTTDGYIYYSSDGGLTWTAQVSGTVGLLNSIFAYDEDNVVAAGDANTLLLTYEGGVYWNVTTGPASKAGVDIIKAVQLDEDHFWLIYEDGYMYYSEDGTDTWWRRIIQNATPAAMIDLAFVPNNNHCAFLLMRQSSYILDYAELYRTVDGGKTWELVDPPSNEGLNALYPCDCNHVVAVGEPYLGTAMVVDAVNP